MSKPAKFGIALVLFAVVGAGGWIVHRFGALPRHGTGVIDESKPHDYYTCSMHPDVHMHEPGRCPICNMTLTKISAGSEARERSTVEGRGVVTLTPEKLQVIGVRFGKVELRSLGKSIRAYGHIAYDPDLYDAQQEYLSAIDLADISKDVTMPASRDRSARLLKASETRLRLLGLNDEQIRRLRDRRQVDPGLLLGAMESGKVWVYADVYESDLSSVWVGLAIDVEATAYPGRTFSGKIQAIDSVLNPQTRTVRVRSEVQDVDGLLKPDMYVNATIHSDFGTALSVAEEAVLNSGNQQYVFVNRGEGRLEPRKVRVGRQAEGRTEVLDGVAEGEEVVVSGNFLIDSESRLHAGLSGMTYYSGREAAEGKGK